MRRNRRSGNLHDLLREFVNSIMSFMFTNFMFMTVLHVLWLMVRIMRIQLGA